ncbi:hypothetical protein D3C84_1209320 [compost metagenome]
MTVYKTIPNSFKAVATSVNQGIPISKLSPNNPVARTLQELGRELVQGGNGETSWWGNLLQHIQGGIPPVRNGGALGAPSAPQTPE